MEALKNLCRKQNICLICTLHQSSSDVLSMTDFLYVLAKGGLNVFWGPTIDLRDYLKVYGIITFDANRVPIETLVRLSAEGLPDIRLLNLGKDTKQNVNEFIELSEYNLINHYIHKTSKKFNYKDVIILIQFEMTKVFRYKYKFYSLDAILTITTSLLLANTFGTDIGKYDDCFGLMQNMSCEERQRNIDMVDRNANYMGLMLWIISLVRIALTIHDKLIKTKYYYHCHRNS